MVGSLTLCLHGGDDDVGLVRQPQYNFHIYPRRIPVNPFVTPYCMTNTREVFWPPAGCCFRWINSSTAR